MPAPFSRCRVVPVQLLLHPDQDGEAAAGVGDVADFVGRQAAAKERPLAVRKPFLDHLVSADGVAPHRLGHIAPAGGVVEIDVEGTLNAERSTLNVYVFPRSLSVTR